VLLAVLAQIHYSYWDQPHITDLLSKKTQQRTGDCCREWGGCHFNGHSRRNV